VLGIDVINDALPEELELATLTLNTITSSARFAPTNLSADLLIQANDEPHGVLHLVLEDQRFGVTGTTRDLVLVITRFGGLRGSIVVNVSAVLRNSSGMAIEQPVFATVSFAANQVAAEQRFSISTNRTLSMAMSFGGRLHSVTRADGLLTATEFDGVSPKLGLDSTDVAVTSQAANGIIRFASSSVSVNENDDVSIAVLRSGGVFGQSTVAWQTSLAAAPDIRSHNNNKNKGNEKGKEMI
jgi:hypothetical protein